MLDNQILLESRQKERRWLATPPTPSLAHTPAIVYNGQSSRPTLHLPHHLIVLLHRTRTSSESLHTPPISHIMPSPPSLRTALLATTTLISTTLLTLSIATLYLTTHYTHALNASAPGGLYTWYGPVGLPEREIYWHDYDAGNLTQDLFHFDYDIENERWILASAAMGLVAGLAGIATCLIGCWNQRQTMVRAM
jgi:hypothetical protein